MEGERRGRKKAEGMKLMEESELKRNELWKEREGKRKRRKEGDKWIGRE